MSALFSVSTARVDLDKIADDTFPLRITGTCSAGADGIITVMVSAPIPRAAPYMAAAYSWFVSGSVRITSDSVAFSLQSSNMRRNRGTSSAVRKAVAVATDMVRYSLMVFLTGQAESCQAKACNSHM